MTAFQQLKLRLKLRQLNKIPCINRGGCAFVAYALAEYFKRKHSSIEVKIIFFTEDWNSYQRDKLRNNSPSSCAHAVIQIESIYYDSRGQHTLQQLKDSFGIDDATEIQPELALDCLQSRKVSWNCAFRRDTGIPKINKILGTEMVA